MDEIIEVSIERIQTIIASLESNEFSTIDVIRGYCGGFFSNQETPAFYSFNAQFGKLLKRNEIRLGIVQVASDVPAIDDRTPPSRTTTSSWCRNA